MNSVGVASLIMLPLATFICVFVALWWCLFRSNKKSNSSTGKDSGSSRSGLRIAKTASREESEVGPVAINLVDEPSVLTEDPEWRTVSSAGKKSPAQTVKSLISPRWISDRKVNEPADQQKPFGDEENLGGAENSVNNEDLTFEENDIPRVSIRSPGKSFMKFLPTLPVKSEKTAPPAEIYSPQIAMSDVGSHPDDETDGGRGNYQGSVDDMDRTLASNDIYC